MLAPGYRGKGGVNTGWGKTVTFKMFTTGQVHFRMWRLHRGCEMGGGELVIFASFSLAEALLEVGVDEAERYSVHRRQRRWLGLGQRRRQLRVLATIARLQPEADDEARKDGALQLHRHARGGMVDAALARASGGGGDAAAGVLPRNR